MIFRRLWRSYAANEQRRRSCSNNCLDDYFVGDDNFGHQRIEKETASGNGSFFIHRPRENISYPGKGNIGNIFGSCLYHQFPSRAHLKKYLPYPVLMDLDRVHHLKS